MSTPTPDHRDGAHFPGCHPEHDTDTREVPAGYQPAGSEDCWHCGTPTQRGGGLCRDETYIPQAAVYHCPACKRWWAWMTGLNITTITFGEEATS
jgi:hypothetical protein